MASRQKVDEYFAAAELDKVYADATEGMFNMMADKFTAIDKLDEAGIASGMGKVHARIKQSVIDKVSEIYCEVFTDDDLNAMMAFANSPVGKKSRIVLPYVQERMMELFTGGIDMDAIFDEVFADLL